MKDDKAYMNHIKKAIQKIEKYIFEINFEVFNSNTMIHDAVIRQLEIIGEATKNLSEDFIKIYPNIPWKLIAGMRDRLIHQYFGVDLKAVWKTVKEDFDLLKNI